jgi:hypothetical protein
MSTVKCGTCGWYHFERSRAEVVQEAEEFLLYYNTQPELVQLQYGKGPFSVEHNVQRQEKCFHCGASYKDFVADDGNCPTGCTIQSVIRRDE